MELIVEVVHPQVKLKATCKALTMGARLDFDAILQQTYFALCLWEYRQCKKVPQNQGGSENTYFGDFCPLGRFFAAFLVAPRETKKCELFTSGLGGRMAVLTK